MLLQMLSAEDVRTVQSISDWEEAIRLAAAPLVRRGSAKEAYVLSLIHI